MSALDSFISGATSSDLFVSTMATKSFYPCTCRQALVGLEFIIQCATASQHVTRQMLYPLSYISSAKNPELKYSLILLKSYCCSTKFFKGQYFYYPLFFISTKRILTTDGMEPFCIPSTSFQLGNRVTCSQ